MARTGPPAPQRNAPPSKQSTAQKPPPSVPEQLRSHVLKTDKNQPICWGYQLGTCPFSKTKAGQRCARGWH
eukprot:3203112-Amphidinium_carterae.1